MRTALACMVLLAVAGCDSGRDEKPTDSSLHATLDLDIRDQAIIDLDISDDRITSARVKLTKGFGVAPEGKTFSGSGYVEAFPEAGVTLYTARFRAKATSDGPCGAEPVSLALALHRKNGEPRLSGSLTPYCGPETWYGIPARTPLRLATPAPAVE